MSLNEVLQYDVIKLDGGLFKVLIESKARASIKEDQISPEMRKEYVILAIKKVLEKHGYELTQDSDEQLGRLCFVKTAEGYKAVDIEIGKDKINIDFQGFVGDECEIEEDSLRLDLEGYGVKTKTLWYKPKVGEVNILQTRSTVSNRLRSSRLEHEYVNEKDKSERRW